MDHNIERAIELLIEENPFFGAVLINLRTTENLDLKFPACITGDDSNNIILYVNPRLLKEFSIEQVVGVLEHECYHVILQHIQRGVNKTGMIMMDDDKIITTWNVASDLAVNNIIKPDRLIKGVLLPEYFKYPKNRSAEQYFDLLKDIKACRWFPVMDEHRWETIDAFSIMEIFQKKSVRRAFDFYKNYLHNSHDHPLFAYPSFEGTKRDFNANEQDSGVHWQMVLRRYLFKQLKIGQCTSWKRRNRRFPVLFPGKRPIRATKLIIAVDTSGSIDSEEFSLFYSEIKKILRLYTQIKITIIEADDDVKKVYQMNLQQDLDIDFIGNGGTDFQPVFSFIKTHSLRPDLCIYFTDLAGEFPENRYFPYPYKVLWVTTLESSDVSVPFGQILVLK